VRVVAVTPGQSADVVIEDGAPVTIEVGQMIDGVKLLRADRDGVVLSTDGITETLPLVADHVTVRDVDAMVIDNDTPPVGLLGMSFLGHFDMHRQGRRSSFAVAAEVEFSHERDLEMERSSIVESRLPVPAGWIRDVCVHERRLTHESLQRDAQGIRDVQADCEEGILLCPELVVRRHQDGLEHVGAVWRHTDVHGREVTHDAAGRWKARATDERRQDVVD
jgi:hypothetical protein